MPRTLRFPSPSRYVCPVCDAPLTDLPCTTCGADLRRPEGMELLRVDGELHRLSLERDALVGALLRPVPPAVDRAVPSPPPPPPPPAPPVPVPSDAGASRRPSRWTVAEILVGLGGLSLVAAVVVFAAVAWSDLAAWAQGALLIGATAAVLGTAVTCHRRGLRATAESLGMVATTLALADVEVARSALDGVVPVRTVWSAGLAVVAVSALALGRRVGLRGTATAGTAIAFLPVPLYAAGLGVDLAVAWVLGGQAVLAAVVAGSLAAAPTRSDVDASLERSVVVTGSVVSWALAAVVGVGDAIDVVIDLDRAPVGACALLAAQATASVAVGHLRRLRALTVAGAALAFVPTALFAMGAGTGSVVAAVLVGQSAVGVAAAAVVRRRSGSGGGALHHVLDAGAAVSAVGAAAVAIVVSVDSWWLDGASVSVTAAATFLALAAVAVGGARFARWQRTTTSLVLVAGVLAVLVAAALARATADGEVITTTVTLTAGVVALVAAALVRLDRHHPWASAMGAAALSVAVLGLAPAAAGGAAAVALTDVVTSSTDAPAATTFRDHLAGAPSIVADDLPGTATMAQLLALAAVALAGIVVGRRWGVWVAAGVGTTALLVAPVAFDASIGVAVLVYTTMIAALGWRLAIRPDEAMSAFALAVVAPVSVGAGLASAPLAIAATALVAGVSVVLAQRALAAASSSASVWVAAALTTGLGGLTLDVVRLGFSGSTPVLTVAIVAALASATGPAIERRYGQDESGAALCADVVTGAALVLAALAAPTLDVASAVVALVALVAGLHALRSDRRPLLGVAIVSVVVVTWMRLAIAEVALLEAYTLPLAGALLVGGASIAPAHRSSWVRTGAGLFAALVPTAVLAMGGDELTRTVAVVVASAAMVFWGAVGREQASLAIGGVVLGAVALRHLVPVADALPRYLVFAVAGIVLLATGATFEQRRGDLRRVRDAFGQLG